MTKQPGYDRLLPACHWHIWKAGAPYSHRYPAATISMFCRKPLPSHWMSSLTGQNSEGMSNRAGRLPEALHLRAGQVSEGCSDKARACSDPGPFPRPNPGAGLFASLGQFSRSGSFRNSGLFCNSEQGQGSLQGLPSGSSMGSTACPHDSSATLRDYLLSSNGSHDTVSSEC